MINEEHFKSPFFNQANQEVSWFRMDSKERYQKNLKTKKTLLEKYNWIDQKFTYRFNSDGFRCENFEEEKNCIVFLGCSHTMGTGLPIETVWTTLVAKKLGLTCYNLGIGGGSNDTAFRLGYHYIPKLKPKIVVMLSPSYDRFEMFDKTQGLIQYGPWKVDLFYKKWSLCTENSILNKLKNKLALNYICNLASVKFLYININEYNNQDNDLARDLAHYGINSHKKFSEHVLRMLD
jgi:hypothetical protein